MLQYPSLPDTQKESLEVTPMSSHIGTRTLEAVLVSPLINGQHVLSFVTLTANMTHSIIKIGRDANSVADNLAKKARRAAVPTCLFSCESWTHSRNCTIQMALENFQ